MTRHKTRHPPPSLRCPPCRGRSRRVVVEPLFRGTSGFSEGLAAVRIIGGEGECVWGYIDRAGGFAIAPQFREAHPFEDGLAPVETVDGRKQLIDETGKVVRQFQE